MYVFRVVAKWLFLDLNPETLLLLFVSGWTVVWFSRYLLTQENREQIKVFQHSPDIHTLYTYSCFLSLSIFA